MTLLNLGLSILPGLLICAYIYGLDAHDREPYADLSLAFGLGALSTLPAIGLETLGMGMGFNEGGGLWEIAVLAFVIVAGSEELCKFVFLKGVAMRRPAFSEPLDGIVYAVMIGMGFATLENVLYAMQFGLETTLLRAFTAVPAHGAFAVLMGYYAGLAKFDPPYRKRLLAKGLGLAILLHGTYDFFLFQNNFPGLAFMAFVALFLGIRYARRLIRLHLADSEERQVLLSSLLSRETGVPHALPDAEGPAA